MWTWKFIVDLGLEHFWENENFGTRKDFEVVVRATIKANEEKFWQARLLTKPKLRLYSKLKTRLSLENYLHEMSR